MAIILFFFFFLIKNIKCEFPYTRENYFVVKNLF